MYGQQDDSWGAPQNPSTMGTQGFAAYMQRLQLQNQIRLAREQARIREEGSGISGHTGIAQPRYGGSGRIDPAYDYSHGSPQYQAQIAQQAALAQAQSPENLMKELAYRQAKQDYEYKQAGRDAMQGLENSLGKATIFDGSSSFGGPYEAARIWDQKYNTARNMAGFPTAWPAGGGGGGKGGGGNAQGQLEQTQAEARAEDAKRRAEEKYYNDMISGGGWAGNPNTNRTLLGVYPQDYTPYNPDTYDQVGDYPGGGSGNSWTPPPEMEGW